MTSLSAQYATEQAEISWHRQRKEIVSGMARLGLEVSRESLHMFWQGRKKDSLPDSRSIVRTTALYTMYTFEASDDLPRAMRS